MFKYILKRLGLMILTFFIIMTFCFILVRALPYSFANQPGSDSYYIELERREALGYNKPILVQYLIFLRGLLTKFDWGITFKLPPAFSPVTEAILEKLPPTMLVNIYTMIVSVPLGIILGVYSALKKNRWQDHFIGILVMVFVSVPSYVYAFLVQYVFGFRLGWFPPQAADGNYLSLAMIPSLVLPIMALSFGTIAGFTRYIRDELSEVLTSEFMLLARTKGLTRRQATFRHAFRNALVPILPMFIGEFIGILGGSLIIENIFGIPGVGKVYLQTITLRDYDAFLFISMFYVAIGLIVGIIVDISYGFVDPRIRIGGRK